MRKILSFVIAAAILVVAIGTWAVAKSRTDNHAKVTAERIAPGALVPLELMKNLKELPVQQHDAF